MSATRTTEAIADRLPRAVPPELVPIVGVAAILRLYRLPAESYWLDEATSITYLATYSLVDLLITLPGNDPHPPLYYVLLYLWSVPFGTSELSTRLLSAIFGVATVIVLYWIGTRLIDRRTGAIAGLLLAVSPFHIWYAQETRMYSLLALTTALSFYLFVNIHDAAEDGTIAPRDEAGYVVATALLGYTHVFGLFAILAQNLYVFSRPLVRTVPSVRLSLRRWIALQAVVGALLSPWLLALVRRVMAAGGGNAGNVSWIPTPTAESVWQTFAAYLGGYQFEESMPLLIAILAAGCLALALSSADRSFPTSSTGDEPPMNATYLLVLWLATPILVPITVSYLVEPIYVIRYSIGASLAFVLLIAKGVSTISLPPIHYVLVGVLVVGLALPLPVYYADDQKEQWRDVAADLEGDVDDGDIVLVSESYTMKPFQYYFDRPGVRTFRVDHDASPDEIHAQIHGHEDVWVVLSHVDSSTAQRLLEAVAEHPEYRGPVESEGYIGIETHRFERTDRS